MDCFVEGICDKMCPENEIKLRIREMLVHFYEKNPKTGRVEKGRMVKAFARSAAGKETTAGDLRTFEALRITVVYLLTEIFPDERKAFHFVYDFIFDRLRAVRQEIVQQNLSPRDTLILIEPMIYFMVVSRYKLCEESIENFDPKICRQHTVECIQTALKCYDELPDRLNRQVIESIYLLINLGNQAALARALSLPGLASASGIFLTALKMSLFCWRNNYYRILTMWSELPTICCIAAAEMIPEIRGKLLATFAVGFHSKQLTVPLTWLQRILRYGDRRQTERDLRRFGVEINGTDVRFDKMMFEKREKSFHSREAIVDAKLLTHPITFPI